MGMDVGTGVGIGIGTTSIPVPIISESSVKQNTVLGTSVRSVRHQNPVSPHRDIKIRQISMRSGSELHIFYFSMQGMDRSFDVVQHRKIGWDKN